MLSIRELTKTYSGGVRALGGITLDIPVGMFGLLGPNGAGKSTLMKILATLLDPDSGAVQLDDVNLLTCKKEIRQVLGYLPQEFGLYPRMRAIDLLSHLATMKGITRKGERKDAVQGLLQQTNLWDSRNKLLGQYSGGMKQRFGIAQALLANPKIVIVDEPTAGLDPGERNRFLNLLSGIGKDVTVIFSTHIVADVRELCANMAVISKGSLILQGNPSAQIDLLRNRIWSKTVAGLGEFQNLEKHFHVISAQLVGGLHEVRVYAETSPGSDFTSKEPRLEDVYFRRLNLTTEADC